MKTHAQELFHGLSISPPLSARVVAVALVDGQAFLLFEYDDSEEWTFHHDAAKERGYYMVHPGDSVQQGLAFVGVIPGTGQMVYEHKQQGQVNG